MLKEIYRKHEHEGGWTIKADTESQEVSLKRTNVPLEIEECYNRLLDATNQFLFMGESYVTDCKFLLKDDRQKFSATFPCEVNYVKCEMKIKDFYLQTERQLKENLNVLRDSVNEGVLVEQAALVRARATLKLREAVEALEESIADHWQELCIPEEDRNQLHIDFFKPPMEAIAEKYQEKFPNDTLSIKKSS